MAEALYRKYRPQVFGEMVGQEHIERTLKNAIEQDKVSHAYLFTGPRGTGKTTTARLLAKALLCEQGPTAEPDGTCEDCELIANGEHPDVNELDAASRTGVDNVREEIIGRVQYAPTRGRYKIYIIDEVHMLTNAAFNALLKTLEEPPSHVVFILATTDPQKVPATIQSRCQRFDFHRIGDEGIVDRLAAICTAEEVDYERDALELIAHKAEGGMRNALTSLEQLIAFGEGHVTLELAERMLGSIDVSSLASLISFVGKRDAAACFQWTADMVETGVDLASFTRDFAERVRNLYVLSLTDGRAALGISEGQRAELVQELDLFGPDRLARMLGVLGDLSAELRTSTNQRLSFEIALTRLVRPDSDLTLAALAERIETLERQPRGPMDVASYASAAGQASLVGAPAGEQSGVVPGLGTPAQAVVPAAVVEAAEAQAAAPTATPNATSAVTSPESPGGIEGAGTQATGAQPATTQASTAVPVTTTGETGPAATSASTAVSAAGAAPLATEAMPASSVVAPGHLAESVRQSFGNPAALQRTWKAILGKVRAASAASGVLFLDTRLGYDPATESLLVTFSTGATFAYKSAQSANTREVLAKAIAEVCGAAIPFTYIMEGEEGAAPSAGFAGVAADRGPASRAGFASAPVESPVATPASELQSPVAAPAVSAQQSSIPAETAAPSSSAPATSTPTADADSPVAAATAASGAPVSSTGEPLPVPPDTSTGATPSFPETPDGVIEETVPVDIYDEEPQTAPWEEPPGSVTPSAETAPWEAPSSVAAQPQETAPWEETSAPAAVSSTDPAQLAEMEATLSATFGGGITFTEVTE